MEENEKIDGRAEVSLSKFTSALSFHKTFLSVLYIFSPTCFLSLSFSLVVIGWCEELMECLIPSISVIYSDKKRLQHSALWNVS